MDKNAKILVLGKNGMVGSSIFRHLKKHKYQNILSPYRDDLDLGKKEQVDNYFSLHRPDYVFLAAAKVGGIYANNVYPADFIYENTIIQSYVIHACWQYKVKSLLFLGSSCIYPKHANQPIKESELMSGRLEETNEPYAVAKISGIKICESYNRQHNTDFRSVMPSNLYGINDNFHGKNSHVIPALITRFHDSLKSNASQITIWGSGQARREFLFINDLADACITVMSIPKKEYELHISPMQSHINIGTGEDITIKDLALMISTTVGFKGKICFDANMPDGTPQKLLDISKIKKMGWKPKTLLKPGIEQTYKWFLDNYNIVRRG